MVEAIKQRAASAAMKRARTAAGAELVRVLRHERSLDQEFRAGRWSVVLDAADRFVRAQCT